MYLNIKGHKNTSTKKLAIQHQGTLDMLDYFSLQTMIFDMQGLFHQPLKDLLSKVNLTLQCIVRKLSGKSNGH